MQKIYLVLLLILLTGCTPSQVAALPCVLSPQDMPATWRPDGETQRRLPAGPWTEREAADATYAITTGLNEMVNLYKERPAAVEDLWEDSVASLIEVTYSNASPASISATATDAARRNLDQLIRPYLERDPAKAACNEYDELLPLAAYAYKQFDAKDPRAAATLSLTNASFADCGSLTKAIGMDYPRLLSSNKVTLEEAFDLVIWSLLFIEGQVVPGLDLPAEAKAMPARLWDFLRTYRLPNADEYSDGAENDEFIEAAYLATHIAYIPTGNHRYPLYVEDSQPLYDFHRENFYAVLEMGELDLVAEFVDSLRQYGCTPGNDLQVRDGTRYLLGVFHGGRDRWMNYREPGEADAEVETYDFIHKAWTGVLGVRDRAIESPEPGTYGGVVRSWLPVPQ
ncbi:hypothetical protein [Crystallibacter degradans]|uniref:hypothetical protein n=1 Tax=Crystallibacter degradans TaxID=2726743 RepID=UPI0014749E1E|nr:hypothetical protein [Arthrobacter sp. SF27]NMR31864.1 hypothetical protein [Arthrobacter sp. SF27]